MLWRSAGAGDTATAETSGAWPWRATSRARSATRWRQNCNRIPVLRGKPLRTCSTLSLLFLGMSNGMSCSAGGPVTAAPFDKFDCRDMIWGGQWAQSAPECNYTCTAALSNYQHTTCAAAACTQLRHKHCIRCTHATQSHLDGQGAPPVRDEGSRVLPTEAAEYLDTGQAARWGWGAARTRPDGWSLRTVVDSSVFSL